MRQKKTKQDIKSYCIELHANLIKIDKEEPTDSWSQEHGRSMTPNPSKTNDNNIRSSHFLLRLKAKELNIPSNNK